jgi:hypothetical protein
LVFVRDAVISYFLLLSIEGRRILIGKGVEVKIERYISFFGRDRIGIR